MAASTAKHSGKKEAAPLAADAMACPAPASPAAAAAFVPPPNSLRMLLTIPPEPPVPERPFMAAAKLCTSFVEPLTAGVMPLRKRSAMLCNAP